MVWYVFMQCMYTALLRSVQTMTECMPFQKRPSCISCSTAGNGVCGCLHVCLAVTLTVGLLVYLSHQVARSTTQTACSLFGLPALDERR